MSILFSGDFHGGIEGELSSITKKTLIKKYGRGKFERIKYQIILGDGAFMWPGNEKTDKFNYQNLALRPFPILCVFGNHEPIYGMKYKTEVDIDIGETVYQIWDKPFIAYLKRGKVYTIDGFKILVLGGASSIDKNRRVPGLSWWPEENWSENEKREVFELLRTEYSFDCVLSHTGPDHVNHLLFEYRGSGHSNKFRDEVALLNDEIHKRTKFKEWWCGHWHRDTHHYNIENKCRYHYLYRKTKILDRVDNEMVVHDEYDISEFYQGGE